MEEKRTEFSMAALGLAELFQIQFGGEKLVVGTKARVQGALKEKEQIYRMEISAPEGLSTGGGKQAVQHIKLVPESGSTIVIGSVNQVEKTAELRTYSYLAQVHAQRFKGAKVPLQEDGYNDVLKRMQAFFANHGLRLIMSDTPRGTAAPARSSGPSTSMIAAGVVALVVAAAAAFFLLRRPAAEPTSPPPAAAQPAVPPGAAN